MDNSQKQEQAQIGLKCEICDKGFNRSNGLKYHLNIIHNLEKKHHLCNICEKVFNI